MKTMRWTHCMAVVAGTWLLLTCAGLGNLAVPFAPMVSAMVAGAVLMIFATFALVLQLQWDGWATLLICAWAVAASSMLRATHALMPLLLIGGVALALCGALLTDAARGRRYGSRRS